MLIKFTGIFYSWSGKWNGVEWDETRDGRGRGTNLDRADGLDLADLLGANVGTGLGADTGSGLVLQSDRLGDLDITRDADLDQQQVDGELLDLGVNAGLDLDRQLGLDLGGNLDRGLGGELDGIRDNVLGLDLDAGSIVVGATLGDDGGNVSLQVGSELGLDLGIDLSLDRGLDRGLEGSRQLGTETEIKVNESAREGKMK